MCLLFNFIFMKEIIGGPITEDHEFLQFHMHWGPNDQIGSEHLVDGKSYAAEVFQYSYHFFMENKKKNNNVFISCINSSFIL